MNNNSRIFVAGHNGMVGSAITRLLRSRGFGNVIVKSSEDLDLRNQQQTRDFFTEYQPEYVFMAAAKVGGIIANSTRKAEFIYDNLMIQSNTIDECYRQNCKRLLFLGSTCIYPKLAPQPIKEEYLLTGPLEPTNDAYALAKIAGIGMCRSYNQQYGTRFLAIMPNNLYGPDDNYDPTGSHVIPALIRRFHEALLSQSPSVTVWGTGTPLREFMHVEDLADAAFFLMNLDEERFSYLLDYEPAPALINIGSGQEISIRDLAMLVAGTVGYQGVINFDNTKPDGTPRKLADSSRLNALGWQHSISLEHGIADAYRWYLEKGIAR